MRWILVLLLLANVLYLGFEMDRETHLRVERTRDRGSVPASAPELRLLGELAEPPPARRADAAGEAVSREGGTTDLVAELPEIQVSDGGMLAGASCFRFGPVPAEDLAAGLRDWFRSRDGTASISSTEAPSRRMFWIYLAPQQSRENALALLEEMKAKGVGDYRLINRGNLENAISLGLYSSREAVDRRLEELGEKGYVPVVVPYADASRVYWLDVSVPAGSAAMARMYDELPAKYESVPVNCGDFSVPAPDL